MTLLRHIAGRIWIAIFFWMLIAIWFLPLLQTIIGIQWIIVPALLLLVLIFVVTGLIANRMALSKMDRLLEEASVYERAGMTKETDQVLNEAVTLFGSCLLFSGSREPYHDKLLARVAQHRLARGGPQIALDRWVFAFLDRFPKDSGAARIWLQSALELEYLPPGYFDLIAKLSNKQPDNDGLQILLGRACLAEGRTDFEALQTYRRVLALENCSDETFSSDLAHVLAAQGLSDEWALDIYLNQYAKFPDSQEILKGILACVRNIGLHEHNRPLLLRARDLLAQNNDSHTDSVEIEQTLLTLQSTKTLVAGETEKKTVPAEFEETLIPTQASATKLLPREHRRSEAKPFGQGRSKVMETFRAVKERGRTLIKNIPALIKRFRDTGMVRWLAVASICGGILFFTVNIVGLLSQKTQISEKPSPTEKVVVTDPFALQVAAYSSKNDAEKHMQQLKKQNLNVYLTKAQGRDQKWFQVRISHFADSKEAEKFGENLKSKGVINDYYVANYKPPIEN